MLNMMRNVERRGPVRALAIVTLLLLAAPSQAGVIRVPEDHVDLQDAIDAASAGDVIAITGGTHYGVTVDKPLTLVGSASQKPSIEHGFFSPGSTSLTPCIRLSTEGVVTLANLTLHTGFNSSSSVFPPPAVSGSCDELRILHCAISSTNPTGDGYQAPANGMWADCERMLFVDSSALGCEMYFNLGVSQIASVENAGSGLSTSGQLTVLDSVLTGADGPFATVHGTNWQCGQPGGSSGSGALAASLAHANSTFTSGVAGAASVNYAAPWSDQPDEVCDLPVAAPIVAQSVMEWDASTLALSSGGFVADQTTTVTVGALGNALLLVGPPDVTAPQVGIAGALYLDADQLSITPINAPSQVTRDITPGAFDPEQWGSLVGLQLYSPGTGLTRPVFMAVLPP